MAAVDKHTMTNNRTISVAINEYRIEKAPATVYYIPNFVSKKEEEQLLERVYKVPKPKWTQLSNRRLQNWGGIPHPNGMLVESIPEWLSIYLDKVWHLGVFDELCKPNHVLINEYLAGQGIMPHFDGPLFYPTITTLSLGSHTVLDFYAPRSEHCRDSTDAKMLKMISLLVEPRSLLILKDEMYSKYLHGIEETDTDTLLADTIPNWSVCELLKNEYQDKAYIEGDKNSYSFGDQSEYMVNENRHHSENQEFNMPAPDSYETEEDDSKKPVMCDSKSTNVKDSFSIGLSDKTITQTLHRKTRVSLTMRHVPKTSKLKIKLGR